LNDSANILTLDSTVTGASVGVIVACDKVPIEKVFLDRYKIQPQVWVSAFTTLANTLLGYAFAQGLAVLFWRLVIRGTTVRAL
jgi:hypothetical protein